MTVHGRKFIRVGVEWQSGEIRIVPTFSNAKRHAIVMWTAYIGSAIVGRREYLKEAATIAIEKEKA